MFQSRLNLFLLLLFIVSCKPKIKTESTEAKKPVVNESTAQQTKIEEAPKNYLVKKSKITIRPVRKEKAFEANNSLLFDKSSQLFIIDQDRDTTLYCIEGTKIKIQKRSFVFEDDNNEPSQVTINIKEYYKMDDIIFADLSTRSGDNILETGGMIFMEAMSEKRKCKLKEEMSFEISFPYDIMKEYMQLFSGNWKNGIIDWVAEEIDSSCYLPITVMASFPGGNNKYLQFLYNNIKFPPSQVDNPSNIGVMVKYEIDTAGKIINISFNESLDKSYKDVILKAFSRMPRWNPAKRNGKPVKTPFEQMIYFYSNLEKEFEADSIYRTNFELTVNDSIINELETAEIRRYVFSSSKLGWINCDRFYRIESSKTDLFVKAGDYPDADVKIVFHSFNGVLEGEKTSLGYLFKGIPSGEKITVLAIAKQKDKNFISLSESTTSSSINELAFEQVTMDVLKQKVAQLNDLRK